MWLLMLGMDLPDENTVVTVHSDFEEAQTMAGILNDELAKHLPAAWIFHVAGPYRLRLG